MAKVFQVSLRGEQCVDSCGAKKPACEAVVHTKKNKNFGRLIDDRRVSLFIIIFYHVAPNPSSSLSLLLLLSLSLSLSLSSSPPP